MQYKFSNGQFVLIEESVFEGLERSKKFVKHYETLLKYTKQSVKRKKVQEELNWWKKNLVEHEEKANELRGRRV